MTNTFKEFVVNSTKLMIDKLQHDPKLSFLNWDRFSIVHSEIPTSAGDRMLVHLLFQDDYPDWWQDHVRDISMFSVETNNVLKQLGPDANRNRCNYIEIYEVDSYVVNDTGRSELIPHHGRICFTLVITYGGK